MTKSYEDLSHQMFNVIGLMRRASLARSSEQHGIHHGQGHLLSVLMEHDNLSQKELADVVHIRAASVTDLLEKMEHEGLVIRTKDEKDRRITRVSISDKGRQFLIKNNLIRHEVNEVVYGDLNDDDLEQLDMIYQKIINSLSKDLESNCD
ncbi:MarR family transcriptional regulator [Paucilactobacillus oligofermentans DSM 15707 = LMG 22743]|nr:MarR family transcriptional regulator [Paucilactobacillus oligofermentans]CUS26633.1 MarR family transcriptional regulator [Paucilactobacillus oligofermentans DSM 15707 = LMG 22743]